MKKVERLIFVDVLRSLAIALALGAHALNDLNVPGRLSEQEFIVVRLLTRAAAPSFIFMFGAMLELVYTRKAEAAGFKAIVPRLVWRSMQCYFGYLVVVAAGLATGLLDVPTALQAALFITGAHWGNVLKFYAVALLVAVALLAFRMRFGLLPTVGLCLLPWALDPVFGFFTVLPLGRFNSTARLFFEMIPHSLTFVGVGMFMGNALRGPREELAVRFHRHAGYVLAVCLAVTGMLMWSTSPRFVLDSYLDYQAYRASFHIGYYVIGLCQAVGWAVLLFWLIPPSAQWIRPSNPALCFGRSSLLSFALGNAVLNFTLGHFDVTAHEGLWLTGAYLVLVFVLVNVQERLLRLVRTHPHLQGLMEPVHWAQEHVAASFSVWLVGAGRWMDARVHEYLPQQVASRFRVP